MPDSIDQITSNAGWDTKIHEKKLKEIISEFKSNGIRTSIFVDPNPTMVEYAKKTGSDRVELYTESFAVGFEKGDLKVINDFIECSEIANSLDMKVNAGHDLNLKNIEYFSTNMPYLHEVSIGHALISESIYLGIDNVINLYIDKLNR